MPNNQSVIQTEEAKASVVTYDNVKKAPILRFGWVVAVVFFAISLAVYCWHFDGGLSPKQSVWGQFGDFMGGLVNPIVGLVTIWLLTVSLNQSHLALHQTSLALKQSEEALKQSAEEIQLAKQALLDNQAIQSKTETALTRQIEVAEEARDIANASSLWESLEQRRIGSQKRIDNREYASPAHRDMLSDDVNSAVDGLRKLERIMEREIDRLDQKYNSPY